MASATDPASGTRFSDFACPMDDTVIQNLLEQEGQPDILIGDEDSDSDANDSVDETPFSLPTDVSKTEPAPLPPAVAASSSNNAAKPMPISRPALPVHKLAVNLDDFKLPPDRSYPIHVNSKVRHISGASLMSDAPSYFTRFFGAQLIGRPDPSKAPIQTLHLDRSSDVFDDIMHHLQGYHITPKNSEHQLRLLMDAKLYKLARLAKMVTSQGFLVKVGDKEFHLTQGLFTDPNNKPNLFQFLIDPMMNMDTFFKAPPAPMTRPPAAPAAVILNRSSELFQDILDLLQGYELHIRNDEHRANLIRDCAFYGLRALEQRLIPYERSLVPDMLDKEDSRLVVTVPANHIKRASIKVAEVQKGKDMIQVLEYKIPCSMNSSLSKLLAIKISSKASGDILLRSDTLLLETRAHDQLRTFFKSVEKVCKGTILQTVAASKAQGVQTQPLSCGETEAVSVLLLQKGELDMERLSAEINDERPAKKARLCYGPNMEDTITLKDVALVVRFIAGTNSIIVEMIKHTPAPVAPA